MAEFLEPGIGLNGYRGEIDPAVHLIGTASLWGGLPLEDAAYEIRYPPKTATNSSVFFIRIGSVPIMPTGFWSITIYNTRGVLEFNPYDSYSHNSLTAKPESDGSYVIYFSAIRGVNMTNWLFTFPGWNYMVRMYQPLDEILIDKWRFPPLQAGDDIHNSAHTNRISNVFIYILTSFLSISLFAKRF